MSPKSAQNGNRARCAVRNQISTNYTSACCGAASVTSQGEWHQRQALGGILRHLHRPLAVADGVSGGSCPNGASTLGEPLSLRDL